MHDAVVPGAEDAHPRLGGERFLAGEDPQDALGEALEGAAIELVGASEAVNDARDGVPLLGIPDVLGELEVLDGGPVGIAALGGAQVHA